MNHPEHLDSPDSRDLRTVLARIDTERVLAVAVATARHLLSATQEMQAIAREMNKLNLGDLIEGALDDIEKSVLDGFATDREHDADAYHIQKIVRSMPSAKGQPTGDFAYVAAAAADLADELHTQRLESRGNQRVLESRASLVETLLRRTIYPEAAGRIAYLKAIADRSRSSTPTGVPESMAALELRPVLKVFMSYVREDIPVVSDLYSALCSIPGVSPWIDNFDLTLGDNWESEIRRAIQRDCNVFLACISRSAVDRGGYFDKEVELALKVAEGRALDRPFILPIVLDDSPIPERLSKFHALRLSTPADHKSLREHLSRLAERVVSE